MPRFVALLRGVNVGKGHRVPMATFRSLLVDLGGTDVRTVLNSGNAVFSHPGRSAGKHAAAITQALQAQLGLCVHTVVLTATDLGAILADNPMEPDETNHSQCLIAVAQTPDEVKALKPLTPLAVAPERFVVGSRAAYLHCPNGILASKVAKALLGPAGRGVTTRNWATALKLAALLHPESS